MKYPMPLTLDMLLSADAELLSALGYKKVEAIGYADLPGWVVVRVPGMPELYECSPACFAEFEGMAMADVRQLGVWLNEQRREKEDQNGQD